LNGEKFLAELLDLLLDLEKTLLLITGISELVDPSDIESIYRQFQAYPPANALACPGH
jgi:hypothetical protein